MTMHDNPLSNTEETLLLKLAKASIQHGLEFGKTLEVDNSSYSGLLLDPGAAFVTLEKRGELRGCIGSVEAYRPLIEDVAENAWQAAFGDPRFPNLHQHEYDQLDLEISILTQATPMSFKSEQDFLAQIVPRRDGLIIEDGYHRGLFLPAVWDKLPSVEAFVTHLKQKAGLHPDHWSDTLTVRRFFCYEIKSHAD